MILSEAAVLHEALTLTLTLTLTLAQTNPNPNLHEARNDRALAEGRLPHKVRVRG